VLWVTLLLGVGAALYSTVGHGGASAYLAILALFSVVPEVMRPTALPLNLVVSGFAIVRFAMAGQISPRLLAIFAFTAAPAAFIGGAITVPPDIYRPLVGLVLLFAAGRLLWRPRLLAERPVRPPSLAIALPSGAALGLLAGLTGTGVGIFPRPATEGEFDASAGQLDCCWNSRRFALGSRQASRSCSSMKVRISSPSACACLRRSLAPFTP